MNDLVTVAKEGGLFSLPVGAYLCTIDPKDDKRRKLLAQAVQTKVQSIAEAVNTTIEVTDLLFHRISIVDSESGEAKELPRLVLFCKDGSMWSTSGKKAVKDALLPAQLFGFELPYKPAQKFKVTKTKTGQDGRGYINLEWVGG